MDAAQVWGLSFRRSLYKSEPHNYYNDPSSCRLLGTAAIFGVSRSDTSYLFVALWLKVFPKAGGGLQPPRGSWFCRDNDTAASVRHITEACLPTAELYLKNKHPRFLPCRYSRLTLLWGPSFHFQRVYSQTVLITSSFASTILSMNISFVGAYLIKITTGCSQIPS